MEPWKWLVFVNIPCLFANLAGMWWAIRIPTPSTSKFCYWINSGALLITVFNLLWNSLETVATYGHGEG